MRYFKYIFISLLLTAPLRVLAASNPEDLLSLPLEDLMQIKVVSSTLTEKSLRTVPSSVTVFTRAQIDAMGIDTLEELLNFVPGIQSYRQADAGNEQYHSVRGRRTGTSSREVLVLLDGKRFQNDFYAGTYVPEILLSNIERVEIIRGPGSSLYGSNAFTGVINITTRKAINRIYASYGHFNRSLLHAQVSQKFEHASLDVNGIFLRDSGDEYVLENPSNKLFVHSRDPKKSFDISLTLANDASKIDLAHSQHTATDFYILEQLSNQYNRNEKQYSSATLQHKKSWHSELETEFQFSYGMFASTTQATFIPPVSRGRYEEETYGVEVKNSLTISDSHSLQFGLERRRVSSDATYLEFGAVRILVGSEFMRDITGLYVQSQTKPFESTELILGARYDDYSNTGSSLSPRLGVVHQLSDTQFVKLLYGKAFRAPAIGELVLSNNNAIVGNLALEPETIKTWELVWGGNWEDQTITATLFRSAVENAIVQGASAVRQFVNAAGQEKSSGLELEYMLQVTPEFQVRTQYSVFNNLPDSAFRQANNLASIIFNYELNKWSFNFSTNHAGEREMLSANHKIILNDYWLANSKVQYVFSDGATLYLQAKNMFNEQYLTPAQGAAFTQGIPNRGREWSLGVNWAL